MTDLDVSKWPPMVPLQLSQWYTLKEEWDKSEADENGSVKKLMETVDPSDKQEQRKVGENSRLKNVILEMRNGYYALLNVKRRIQNDRYNDPQELKKDELWQEEEALKGAFVKHNEQFSQKLRGVGVTIPGDFMEKSVMKSVIITFLSADRIWCEKENEESTKHKTKPLSSFSLIPNETVTRGLIYPIPDDEQYAQMIAAGKTNMPRGWPDNIGPSRMPKHGMIP